jgi:hypothetical protein
MDWQVVVPGTHTLTVTNKPFVAGAVAWIAAGPGSTTMAATLLPVGGVIEFPPAEELLLPPPQATKTDRAQLEIKTNALRTGVSLLNLGGLYSLREHAGNVRAADEVTHMAAHFNYESGFVNR